jgi:uncharacterized repeat protein (TIGR01451 family)
MRGLKIICLAFIGLVAFAGPAAAFSTHSVTLERSFDKTQELVGGEITVTATLTNLEANGLRGFYLTEHIPQGLSVQTVSVKVDGNNISNFLTEAGLSGDVYTDCVPYRWILETPSAFSENNPITSGVSVEVVYVLSSTQIGTFPLNEFNWVGYYQAASDAGFGHSEASDRRTLSFYLVAKGDLDNSGVIELRDAILGLQLVVGITPSSQTYVAADVNGDGVLGTAEVIYVLQSITGLR